MNLPVFSASFFTALILAVVFCLTSFLLFRIGQKAKVLDSYLSQLGQTNTRAHRDARLAVRKIQDNLLLIIVTAAVSLSVVILTTTTIGT
jgi:hypothetical protein